MNFEDPKDCFGEPPKPAREPRALPGIRTALFGRDHSRTTTGWSRAPERAS